jgi:hypothetical protein
MENCHINNGSEISVELICKQLVSWHGDLLFTMFFKEFFLSKR